MPQAVCSPVFNSFDINGDGVLGKEELNHFMQAIGIGFTQRKVAADLIDDLDHDHNGQWVAL